MEVVVTVEARAVPHRSGVRVEYTWDLTTVYASDEVWEQDVARLEGMMPEIVALQGKVGQSAQSLLKTLQLRDEAGALLYQIYIYASHRKDADSTDSEGQALDERAGSLAAKISAGLAFIEPEILAMPEATIAAWLHEEPGLQIYTY